MQKKKYRNRYYDVPEEDLQAIIALSKQGDNDAQERLFEIFDNFLQKYVNLLYHGRYSLQDYETRRFISLFIKDGTLRRFLMRNALNHSGRQRVSDEIRGITFMVQRFGDQQDVEQTVQFTFLQCVGKYTRYKDIPFSGYLYNYFFYLMKKNVDLFLIDQLGRKSFPLLTDEDANDDHDGEERPPGFVPPPSPSVEDLLFMEEIDERWVAGDNAYPPFDNLTIQERQLLKWRYVDGERSSEIARRVTEHPNTTREAINRIKKKLREIIEEDEIYY